MATNDLTERNRCARLAAVVARVCEGQLHGPGCVSTQLSKCLSTCSGCLSAVYEQASDMSVPQHSVVTCLRQWRPKLVETGFQELVFEDALEVWPPLFCLRRCPPWSGALQFNPLPSPSCHVPERLKACVSRFI